MFAKFPDYNRLFSLKYKNFIYILFFFTKYLTRASQRDCIVGTIFSGQKVIKTKVRNQEVNNNFSCVACQGELQFFCKTPTH